MIPIEEVLGWHEDVLVVGAGTGFVKVWRDEAGVAHRDVAVDDLTNWLIERGIRFEMFPVEGWRDGVFVQARRVLRSGSHWDAPTFLAALTACVADCAERAR